jgi:hypothetical protein
VRDFGYRLDLGSLTLVGILRSWREKKKGRGISQEAG